MVRTKALRTKLRRDMTRGAMQFISIILLCSLGTLLFAGLDGIARMVQETNDAYFTENHLADFWITVSDADRQTMDRIRRIPGVREATARTNVDMKSTLPKEPIINVLAYDGAMDINTPLLSRGEMIGGTDVRGCLLQVRFAEKHGLDVGDTLRVQYAQDEYAFIIRGLVYSPEHIGVTLNVSGNNDEYGFVLVNARALEQLPRNQVVVTLSEGASASAVKQAIETALPEALVIDRQTHESTMNAVNNGVLFANLSLLFPLLAYAVACMIVMTTLTRMIGNQRIQIGTLKALGYSTGQITRHYLSYAFWPSLLGSVLGVVAGHYLLPPFIWNMLIGQSEYPYRLVPVISLPAWGTVVLSVVSSVMICLIMLRRSVHEPTASLLRPKAPEASKRLFLERFPRLWSRLGFNAKMVLRNLTRNKLRTVMSCVGLLCCNALLIASFGIQDSVDSVTANHYTKTLHYTVRANLTGDAGEAGAYEKRLEAEAVQSIMERAARISAGGISRTALMTVVGDEQNTLYLGEHETLVQIVPGAAAITFKLAQTLGVEVGDTIRLDFPADDEAVRIPVGQIVHNNVSQGVYLARSTWEGLRRGGFVPTAILLDRPAEKTLQKLDGMDEVDSLDRPADQIGDMQRMLEALTGIFMIISLVALSLAFVICYNMGLMNFVERTREYATLKVLGYHQREIRRLILLENLIITVIGVGLGIGAGILLTGGVMVAVQTESIRYPTVIQPLSIVIASLITAAFSFIIQLFLTRKVRKVVMVEALQSVE